MTSSYLFTLLVLVPSYLTVDSRLGRSLDRLAPHHLLASGGRGTKARGRLGADPKPGKSTTHLEFAQVRKAGLQAAPNRPLHLPLPQARGQGGPGQGRFD